jgi:hypothetical protein
MWQKAAEYLETGNPVQSTGIPQDQTNNPKWFCKRDASGRFEVGTAKTLWTHVFCTATMSSIVIDSSYFEGLYLEHCYTLVGHAVVEALRYKPDGRQIDSGWCHRNFSSS